MPRPLYRAVLLLGAMTLPNCARVYAQTGQTALRPERVAFRVRIYNDEGVPEGNLLTAQKVADAVLERAGLEPMWQECTVNNPNRDSSGCDIHTGGIDLVLYLVAQLEAHAPNVRRSALGYSVIPGKGELATMAYVCYGRVRTVSLAFPSEELLGLAMAHEIGHLLLGTNAHSNSGLMRAKWPRNELAARQWEGFVFTRDQTSQLRALIGSVAGWTAQGQKPGQSAAQTNGRSSNTETFVPVPETAPESYAVFGATPPQEAALRAQIRLMHPEVLPLRVFFVPHWKYLDNARIFHLYVPTGYGNLMFTHLPSRTVFIDDDRYLGEEWLGHWIAHELGHLATNSAKEGDAESAARELRKHHRDSQRRDLH